MGGKVGEMKEWKMRLGEVEVVRIRGGELGEVRGLEMSEVGEVIGN